MRTFRATSNPAKAQKPEVEGLPWWKRSIDLAFCCAVAPVFAITTFFVAALMSITSPGPIFFRQERVGQNGRKFRLYKFRTMHVGADTTNHAAYFSSLMASNAPMQKLDAKGDARLIPFGWFIRAVGLDELPQMINVLRGEMSVIGPRPCIPYEYENYSPTQRSRFQSVPGLTGLWQVSGKNRTTFERMIQLDVEYAARRSLFLDLKILSLTAPAILSQLWDMCSTRYNAKNITATIAKNESACKSTHITKEAPSVRAS